MAYQPGTFDDIFNVAQPPPQEEQKLGSYEELFSETEVVEAKPNPYDNVILRPVEEASQNILNSLNDFKDDVMHIPALQGVFEVGKEAVSPIKFAAGKAAAVPNFIGKAALKLFEGTLLGMDKFQRHTQGAMVSDVIRGGIFPGSGPGNPELADRMGPTPSMGEIIKAISPEIDKLSNNPEGKSNAINPFVQAFQPDTETTLGKAALGFTAPMRAALPGAASATTAVLESARSSATPSAFPKFMLGAGLMATDPNNLIFAGGAKAASAILKTTAATKTLEKVAENILAFVPDEVKRGLQLGEFKVPPELEELFDARARKIAGTYLRGEKVTNDLWEMTPAERLRLGQIRTKGSISVSEGEKGIRDRERRFGHVIDTLSSRLLKYNEDLIKHSEVKDATGKVITEGKGFLPEQTAEIIRANLGEYLPRDYALFHGKFKEGRIPNSALMDIFELSGKQQEALSGLSPQAAEDYMNLMERVRRAPYPDASGFKPVRIRQGQFKSRVEAERGAKLYEELTASQDKLKERASEFGWNKLFNRDSDAALMNEARLTVDDLAAYYRQPAASQLDMKLKLSQALKREVSVAETQRIGLKASEIVDARNKLMGQIGDLEFQKRPHMLKFQSEAKFGLNDLAAFGQDTQETRLGVKNLADPLGVAAREKSFKALASDLSGLLGKTMSADEAEGIAAVARKYVAQGEATLSPNEKLLLADAKNAIYDFENYQIALGKIDDPAVLGAKAIRNLTLAGENANLFNQIAFNPEWTLAAEATAKAGYVKLADSPMLGALKNRYVKAQIADEIDAITSFQNNFDKTGWKLMAGWKFGKTVANPASYFRNGLNNIVLLDILGDVNLKRQAEIFPEAFEAVLSRDARYTRAVKAGALKGTFYDAELRKMYDTLLEVKKEGGGMMEYALSLPSKVGGSMGRAYSSVEEIGKMVKFMDGISQGVSDVDAAKAAVNTLFDMGKVPPLIRHLRAHPMGAPFITYPYKAIPAIAQRLKDNPLAVLKYEYMFRAIEAGSAAAQGVDPDVAEAQKQIAKKSSPLFTRFLRLPHTDGNGWPYFLDLTYILPWGDLGDMGSLFGIPPSLTPLALAKPFAEVAFNRSLYTNKQIWGDEKRFHSALDLDKVKDEEGLEVVQKITGHLVKSFAPSLFGIPGTPAKGWGYERLERSILKKSGSSVEAEPQPLSSAVLDTIYGIKTRAQSFTEIQRYKWESLKHDMKTVENELENIARQVKEKRLTPQEGNIQGNVRLQVRAQIVQEISKLADTRIE